MGNIMCESKKVAVSLILMFVILDNLPVANSLKTDPFTTNRQTTIATEKYEKEQCCYIDGCSKEHICVSKTEEGTILTDACARTYNVDSNCVLTTKSCCFTDDCNGDEICREAVSVFKDSCESFYLVQPNCKVHQVLPTE